MDWWLLPPLLTNRTHLLFERVLYFTLLQNYCRIVLYFGVKGASQLLTNNVDVFNSDTARWRASETQP